VDLDVSSGALGTLRQDGAGERILNTVLWAEAPAAARKQAEAAPRPEDEEDRAAPGLPEDPGVYFKSSTGWAPVPSFLFWAPLYSGTSWVHGAKQYSVPLDNAHSGLQIPEIRPSFYVREPSGDAWQIIRLTTRKDQRQFRMTSTDGWATLDRIPASEVRDASMTHAAGEIFVLRPNADLQAGEYLLCTAVSGGAGLKACYSFGIQGQLQHR
jgi:hypothetical protein